MLLLEFMFLSLFIIFLSSKDFVKYHLSKAIAFIPSTVVKNVH